MVQSINNPLWPMALVHAVSKVVKEKILCVAEKNAWILLLGFRIFFWRQLYIRNTCCYSRNAHLKCETTLPLLTLLIIVCMKMGCSKFIRRLKNTLWWLGFLQLFVIWFCEIHWRCTTLSKSYYQVYVRNTQCEQLLLMFLAALILIDRFTNSILYHISKIAEAENSCACNISFNAVISRLQVVYFIILR